jgi:hypothetical protein
VLSNRAKAAWLAASVSGDLGRHWPTGWGVRPSCFAL